MKKFSGIARIVVICVVTLSLLCSSALAASYGAKVLSATMSVYSQPDASGAALGALKQGSSFTVTAISGDWARISYNGKTGYASMQHILFNKRIKATVTADSTLVYVTKASVPLNISFSAAIQKDVTVYVVGMYNGKALVQNAAGSALGYMPLNALAKAL